MAFNSVQRNFFSLDCGGLFRKAVISVLVLMVISVTLLRGESDAKTPATRTSMSDDELGHLVNFARLASQPLDDWHGWEGHDQEGMEAYRYQIAFMSYTLALQQYLCVPAWREVHKAAMDRLMERMIQKPVWEFWAEVSRTRREFDPDWDGPKESKHDPVGEKNIMYSGHIVHIGALYEMLYRDTKWSQPGAITFRWDDKESYAYDLQSLMKVIQKEMLSTREKESGCVAGVECEPNLIFPECNQHPLLAFQLNDHNHDTALYGEARKKLGNFFDCSFMYDPQTKNVANCWRVKQGKLFRVPGMASASADGWTGAFMHSWRPDMIREAYVKQRDRDLKRTSSGELQVAFDPAFELGLGFFTLLAAEMGDDQTANELFDYAEKHYSPVREKGMLRYPPARGKGKDSVSNTTDKVLAMAQSDRADGILNLHERPWGDKDFEYPLVEGIDFPRVLVSEARWNADRNALTIELAAGFEFPPQTTFRIRGVKPGENWVLSRDGNQIGVLGPDNLATGAVAREGADAVAITVPMQSRVRMEFRRSN